MSPPPRSSPPPIPALGPAAASGLPLDPPARREHEDWVPFAARFAEQLKVVTAAARARPELTADLWAGLAENADHRVRELQAAVNAALGAKQMDRMKALTVAKNQLYQALLDLRAVAAEETAETRAVPRGPAAAAGSPARQPAASALSRAAEEKAAARQAAAREAAAQQKQKQRQKQKQKGGAKQGPSSRVGGSALKATAAPSTSSGERLVNPLWLLLALAGLGVLSWFAIGWLRGPQQSRAAGNRPPVMKSVSIVENREGVVLTVKAEDPEGDSLAFDITWHVNGTEAAGEHGMQLGRGAFAKGDRVEAEVTATDGEGRSQPMRSPRLVCAAIRSAAGVKVSKPK